MSHLDSADVGRVAPSPAASPRTKVCSHRFRRQEAVGEGVAQGTTPGTPWVWYPRMPLHPVNGEMETASQAENGLKASATGAGVHPALKANG